MSVVRPNLPPLPRRIAALPIDERGYPVPWFVSWVDGKPEFRVADPAKLVTAVRFKRCWVCGGELGRFLAFVIGPMCAVNRISAEPPSHRECAEFSATACPFLTLPQMRRRENDLPEHQALGGQSIGRNPGVALVWITKSYHIVRDVNRKPLFQVGAPEELAFYAEGRPATRAEVFRSMATGLPILLEEAIKEGTLAVEALEQQYVAALRLLPKESA